MSILVRFAPASMTEQQYRSVLDKMSASDEFSGCELHVCFGSEGNLRVSEIWASREQFDKFAERLMPAIAEAGIEGGAPEFFDVVNVINP
jgi:hypothetical protein